MGFLKKRTPKLSAAEGMELLQQLDKVDFERLTLQPEDCPAVFLFPFYQINMDWEHLPSPHKEAVERYIIQSWKDSRNQLTKEEKEEFQEWLRQQYHTPPLEEAPLLYLHMMGGLATFSDVITFFNPEMGDMDVFGTLCSQFISVRRGLRHFELCTPDDPYVIPEAFKYRDQLLQSISYCADDFTPYLNNYLLHSFGELTKVITETMNLPKTIKENFPPIVMKQYQRFVYGDDDRREKQIAALYQNLCDAGKFLIYGRANDYYLSMYHFNEEYLVDEGLMSMEELHQLHPTYIYRAKDEIWYHDMARTINMNPLEWKPNMPAKKLKVDFRDKQFESRILSKNLHLFEFSNKGQER